MFSTPTTQSTIPRIGNLLEIFLLYSPPFKPPIYRITRIVLGSACNRNFCSYTPGPQGFWSNETTVRRKSQPCIPMLESLNLFCSHRPYNTLLERWPSFTLRLFDYLMVGRHSTLDIKQPIDTCYEHVCYLQKNRASCLPSSWIKLDHPTRLQQKSKVKTSW